MGLLAYLVCFLVSDSVVSAAIICLLVFMSLRASFNCACTGFLAIGAIAIGEFPDLVALGPCASAVNFDVLSTYLTDHNKMLGYGGIAAFGIYQCFIELDLGL